MRLRITERERERSKRFRKVARSGEFRRIEALPRRDWTTERSTISDVLATGDQALWPIQEAALREAMQVRGLLGIIAVGKGKALVSILAPVVMGAERPVLFVPADLRAQTKCVLAEAKQHWIIPNNLKVLGYSELSLEKNATMLHKLRPDLIIADEAHNLKDPKTGRGRRLVRYMREFPETKFVALSGTMTRKSIRDYAHIAEWCLKDRSPLPRTWREQSDWADAIDAGIPFEQRIAAGALSRFGDDVHEGYRKRLTETRGVIASGEDELATSLHIIARPIETPLEIKIALSEMRATWMTPSGEEITEATDFWRHGRELAAGFYYVWDPPPPKKWAWARKAWNQYVSETLKNNRRNLDTELQVWKECVEQNGPEVFRKWAPLKFSFRPNTKAIWLDDFILDDATEWLDKGEGIVWVDHKAVGERLAKLSGARYFGAGAKASSAILDARGPIIASIHAHGTGKNLHHYHRNLVISAPSAGATWEQLLGRTHRPKQEADTVTYEVYQHTPELREGFERALSQAEWLQQTHGSRQKLLYADLAMDKDTQ